MGREVVRAKGKHHKTWLYFRDISIFQLLCWGVAHVPIILFVGQWNGSLWDRKKEKLWVRWYKDGIVLGYIPHSYVFIPILGMYSSSTLYTSTTFKPLNPKPILTKCWVPMNLLLFHIIAHTLPCTLGW